MRGIGRRPEHRATQRPRDAAAGRRPADQARTYGFWRSQLMQVSVQKFARTTWPRSSVGPSGSELSHPVAPPSVGICTRASTVT